MSNDSGPGTDIQAMQFHEVDASRWQDLVALFDRRGGPRGCWCMIWRQTAEESRDTSGPFRRAALERRVMEGTPIGLIGYVQGEPAAWCSIAPRDTYSRRLGGDDVPGEDPGRVWSLACFFVPREFRHRGMMRQLLAAAIEHARSRGATAVEAYPVDPDSPSYRFMGFVETFRDAGFEEVGRAGTRRHIMRLPLP